MAVAYLPKAGWARGASTLNNTMIVMRMFGILATTGILQVSFSVKKRTATQFPPSPPLTVRESELVDPLAQRHTEPSNETDSELFAETTQTGRPM